MRGVQGQTGRALLQFDEDAWGDFLRPRGNLPRLMFPTE